MSYYNRKPARQPFRFAESAPRDAKRKYVTLADAAATDRCICQGCHACRGERGYPCGALATPERCRHCDLQFIQ